jgi:hypothetical protein
MYGTDFMTAIQTFLQIGRIQGQTEFIQTDTHGTLLDVTVVPPW